MTPAPAAGGTPVAISHPLTTGVPRVPSSHEPTGGVPTGLPTGTVPDGQSEP